MRACAVKAADHVVNPQAASTKKETMETMQPLIVGRDITSVGAFT
jgi:hypothetical protein